MSKSAKTRQKILAAAQAMLLETGLSAFRIEQLVAQLGLTRQTVYRYFNSKDELIKHIIFEHGKTLSEEVFGELVRRGLPFREFLAEGVIVGVNMISNDKSLQKIVGDDLQLAMTAMIANFKEMEDELAPIVEPFVAEAKADGTVKPNVSTRDIMRWVFRSFLSEMLVATLEPVEIRRAYLMKMMVPAICVTQ